jgi:hypothetical protein
MPTITSFLSAPRLRALLALALTATLVASASAAVTSSPFRNFIGQWSGSGQLIGSDGHRESMRCRAEYSEVNGGAAVNQAIVCASESFKFDIRSHVEASGESVQGYWTEVSRNVSGNVGGRISEGRFEGEFSAPAFSAGISITSNGRRQTVSIQPRGGGGIASVRIELARRG